LIPEFLRHGAEANGFRGDVWTCARVAKVIQQELGFCTIGRNCEMAPDASVGPLILRIHHAAVAKQTA
jgi:hypothetical protein